MSDLVSECLVGTDWNSKVEFWGTKGKGIDSDVHRQMIRHSVGQVNGARIVDPHNQSRPAYLQATSKHTRQFGSVESGTGHAVSGSAFKNARRQDPGPTEETI